MTANSAKKINPLRQTSPQAIMLAKTLIRSARFGALGALDPNSREPCVTRVAVATTVIGAPVLLISSLSLHTKSLIADRRCALLLAEPGKGDPLAHPRISIQCDAVFLDKHSDASKQIRARYLLHNPKSKLYADFQDFSFVLLNPNRALLNGGFGQAFQLNGSELLIDSNFADKLEKNEMEMLSQFNRDHKDMIQEIGAHFSSKSLRRWRVTSVDPEGVIIAAGDMVSRVWFKNPAKLENEIYLSIIELLDEVRATKARKN